MVPVPKIHKPTTTPFAHLQLLCSFHFSLWPRATAQAGGVQLAVGFVIVVGFVVAVAMASDGGKYLLAVNPINARKMTTIAVPLAPIF